MKLTKHGNRVLIRTFCCFWSLLLAPFASFAAKPILDCGSSKVMRTTIKKFIVSYGQGADEEDARGDCFDKFVDGNLPEQFKRRFRCKTCEPLPFSDTCKQNKPVVVLTKDQIDSIKYTCWEIEDINGGAGEHRCRCQFENNISIEARISCKLCDEEQVGSTCTTCSDQKKKDTVKTKSGVESGRRAASVPADSLKDEKKKQTVRK